MPYVTATFWDMHQCKQLLSKRLMKWPTDKTKDIKLHCEQVLKDEVSNKYAAFGIPAHQRSAEAQLEEKSK